MTIKYTAADIAVLFDTWNYSAGAYGRLPSNKMDLYYHHVANLDAITTQFLLQDTVHYLAKIKEHRKPFVAERRVLFIFDEAPFGACAMVVSFSDLILARAQNITADAAPEQAKVIYKEVSFYAVIPHGGKARVQAWHQQLGFPQSSRLAHYTGFHGSSVGLVDELMYLFIGMKKLSPETDAQIEARQRDGCAQALTNWFAVLKTNQPDDYQEIAAIIQILVRYDVLMRARETLVIDEELSASQKAEQDKIAQQEAFTLDEVEDIVFYLSLKTILQLLRLRHTTTGLKQALLDLKAEKQRHVAAWPKMALPQPTWSAWFYERGSSAVSYVWRHTFAGILSSLFARLSAYIPDAIQTRFLQPFVLGILGGITGFVAGAGYMYYLGLYENLFAFGLLFLMDSVHSFLNYQWVDLSAARIRSLKDTTPGSYRPSIAALLSVTSILVLGFFCWQQRAPVYLRRGAAGISGAEFFGLLFRQYAKTNTKLTEQDKTHYEHLFKVFGLVIGDTSMQMAIDHSLHESVRQEFEFMAQKNNLAISQVHNNWWSLDFFAPYQLRWEEATRQFSIDYVIDQGTTPYTVLLKASGAAKDSLKQKFLV